MSIWRTARDRNETIPIDLQAELDNLVQAELQAAIARTCLFPMLTGYLRSQELH